MRLQRFPAAGCVLELSERIQVWFQASRDEIIKTEREKNDFFIIIFTFN